MENQSTKLDKIWILIKKWNVKISIGILALICILIFFDGIRLFLYNKQSEEIPRWLILLLGYCGLVVVFKLSNLLEKEVD